VADGGVALGTCVGGGVVGAGAHPLNAVATTTRTPRSQLIDLNLSMTGNPLRASLRKAQIDNRIAFHRAHTQSIAKPGAEVNLKAALEGLTRFTPRATMQKELEATYDHS
jgi:hypothetical protein